MKNYRTRIWAVRRGDVDGHAFTVHDPNDRRIADGWEPGDRRWAQDVARDAVARDLDKRAEAAA